jgi:methionyl-tRNA formyltransferase
VSELVLFAYDAPHWKTERFLFELASLGLGPDRVVAAPWRRLNLPPAMRMAVRHAPRHPRELCARLGVRYEVCPHEEVVGQANAIGVIGGARILPRTVIDTFRGILNLHPGAIPANRGLSNIARAIQHGWPQVVTAHLIDRRVDAGMVLFAQEVPVRADDTIHDLAERMLDTQVAMLARGVAAARRCDGRTVAWDAGGYEKPLTESEERRVVEARWESYRRGQALAGTMEAS